MLQVGSEKENTHPSPATTIMLPRQQRCKLISEDKLISAFESELSSQSTPELAVVHLLSHYDVDLDDLGDILFGLYFLETF